MTRSETQERINAGDPAQWLDQHGDYLFACAVRHLCDAPAAEDVVQETLLAAIASRDKFEARSSVRTWLTAILKHKLLDHQRQAKRLQTSKASAVQRASDEEVERWVDQQFTPSGKWKNPPGNWGNSPQDGPEQEEFRAILARCVEKLPAKAAETLMVAERQEGDAESIGNILSLTATNVRVLLYRARSALRRCLEVHWFGRESGSKTR